jgi:hypothetical protein
LRQYEIVPDSQPDSEYISWNAIPVDIKIIAPAAGSDRSNLQERAAVSVSTSTAVVLTIGPSSLSKQDVRKDCPSNRTEKILDALPNRDAHSMATSIIAMPPVKGRSLIQCDVNTRLELQEPSGRTAPSALSRKRRLSLLDESSVKRPRMSERSSVPEPLHGSLPTARVSSPVKRSQRSKSSAGVSSRPTKWVFDCVEIVSSTALRPQRTRAASNQAKGVVGKGKAPVLRAPSPEEYTEWETTVATPDAIRIRRELLEEDFGGFCSETSI